MEQPIILLKRRDGGITYMVHQDYIKEMEYFHKLMQQYVDNKYSKPSKS